MTIDKTLYDMCRDTVVVQTPETASTSTAAVAVDAYGIVIYPTSTGHQTTYHCRIVDKPKVIRAADGSEVVTNAQIVLTEDVEIDPRSKITLSRCPSGCSSQPQILWVGYYPDAVTSGLSHSTIYV
jgi:hypothetical protein